MVGKGGPWKNAKSQGFPQKSTENLTSNSGSQQTRRNQSCAAWVTKVKVRAKIMELGAESAYRPASIFTYLLSFLLFLSQFPIFYPFPILIIFFFPQMTPDNPSSFGGEGIFLYKIPGDTEIKDDGNRTERVFTTCLDNALETNPQITSPIFPPVFFFLRILRIFCIFIPLLPLRATTRRCAIPSRDWQSLPSTKEVCGGFEPETARSQSGVLSLIHLC